MKKIILSLILLGVQTGTVYAANVTSVSCSLNSVVIDFDAAISSGDVTNVSIQSGENAKVSYDLNDTLPGSLSPNTRLTLSPSGDSQDNMKRIPPWKAYIKVNGEGIDSGAGCS